MRRLTCFLHRNILQTETIWDILAIFQIVFLLLRNKHIIYILGNNNHAFKCPAGFDAVGIKMYVCTVFGTDRKAG